MPLHDFQKWVRASGYTFNRRGPSHFYIENKDGAEVVSGAIRHPGNQVKPVYLKKFAAEIGLI